MKKTILGYSHFVCAFRASRVPKTIWSGNECHQTGADDGDAFGRVALQNYIEPYNIEFRYRYEDMESDIDLRSDSANYEKSVQMAKLVKHLCLRAYDEVTGRRDFITSYFPEDGFLVGSPAYNNNGEVVLGTARRRKAKITPMPSTIWTRPMWTC